MSKGKKFYALRRPCDNCPFRTDIKPYLRRDRAVEIVQNLGRGTFSCHKTIDYDALEDNDPSEVPGPTEKQCAGAMIMQEKAGHLGQMGRIAERLKIYDHEKLDMDAPVFESPAAFIQAQENDREEMDPCGVCGPGCEAPAGYVGGVGPVATPNYTELGCCYECGEYACDSCSEEHPEHEGHIICMYCYEELHEELCKEEL